MLSNRKVFVAATFALAAAQGCESSTAPERGTGPLIRTDAVAYELELLPDQLARVDIPYTFENRTEKWVEIPNCLGGYLLRVEGLSEEGDWISAWTRAILACQSAPILITRGGTFTDTLRLQGTLPGPRGGPEFGYVSPLDTYRIVVQEAYSLTGDLLPLEDRVSNGFLLRQP